MSSSTDATRIAIFVTETAAKILLVLIAAFVLARMAAPRLGEDGKPICDASQTPPATSSTDGSSPN